MLPRVMHSTLLSLGAVVAGLSMPGCSRCSNPAAEGNAGGGGPIAVATAMGLVGRPLPPMPANAKFYPDVAVEVVDSFGNPIPGKLVTWRVVSGPVSMSETTSTTNRDGISTARIRPTGTTGSATVEASVEGGAVNLAIVLSVTPPGLAVYFVPPAFSRARNGYINPAAFYSAQNGSSNPAVDTIPAGQTLSWLFGGDFVYSDYYVTGLGVPPLPSFVITNFSNSFAMSSTPAAPATYRYSELSKLGWVGILVVR